MKCGAYETQITPALGLMIPGYFIIRPAEDVLDELYAKAVVFDNGERVCGFLVLDILHVTAGMVKSIRERFEELTGVSGKDIMISATHAHTGQSIEHNDEFGVADDDWVRFTCMKSADALVLAYRRRKDCKVGFGRTYEYDLSFNRRFWQKDGAVHTWPGICNPDNVREAAPMDPEICVVRVDDIEGNTIALITDFANHLDLIGGCAYSGDYPAELSRVIKDELGQNVVSVFMNGFSGDVTHIDYNGGHPFGPNAHIQCGRLLARDVLSVYDDIICYDIKTLDAASKVVRIDRRQPTKEMYEWGKKRVAMGLIPDEEEEDDGFEKPSTGNNMLMELCYAKSNVSLTENPILFEDVELQVIKVGDIVFNGAPGELFAELGLNLKERSEFDRNVNVELANGCYGYIATKHAFKEGGYEVTFDRYVNMSEDTGDIMVDTLLELQGDIL